MSRALCVPFSIPRTMARLPISLDTVAVGDKKIRWRDGRYVDRNRIERDCAKEGTLRP